MLPAAAGQFSAIFNQNQLKTKAVAVVYVVFAAAIVAVIVVEYAAAANAAVAECFSTSNSHSTQSCHLDPIFTYTYRNTVEVGGGASSEKLRTIYALASLGGKDGGWG